MPQIAWMMQTAVQHFTIDSQPDKKGASVIAITL